MPAIAHHGIGRHGGTSDVIASAECPSCAKVFTIAACSSDVLAVAMRMHVGNCCIVFCSRDLVVSCIRVVNWSHTPSMMRMNQIRVMCHRIVH